jgi:pimeloyl-ACP methyl ester carboxylesterase
MSESRFVEANGIRLHYLDHGGDGPALVLLHGLSANAHFFDGLAASGLASSLRVLSFDLRGRGLSDAPDSGYTMDDHAADLLGALDALGLDRVVLGGHSFGGLLTLFVAATAPERVERALVLDVPADADPAVLEQIGPSLSRLEQVYPSREAYLDFVRALPYFDGDGWDDDIAAFYEAEIEELPDGTVRPRCRPAHIRLAVEGTFTPDWEAVGTSVECPTLLLRTTDPFGPPGSGPILSADGARRTLARLRHGHLVEVPGNHITFAFGSRARRVSELLVAFVEDADAIRLAP